jgi:hypothetical protein
VGVVGVIWGAAHARRQDDAGGRRRSGDSYVARAWMVMLRMVVERWTGSGVCVPKVGARGGVIWGERGERGERSWFGSQ